MKINPKEVLYYLGARDVKKDEMIEEIMEVSEELMMDAQKLSCVQYFPLVGRRLEGTNFELMGKDMESLLKDCTHVILLAATLGHTVERKLQKLEQKDLSKAILYDTCASVLIESLINEIHQEILVNIRKKGLFLTDRFSPGYGDFHLEAQKDIFRILQLERRLGLTLNHGLMIPRKSITAVIGVCHHKMTKRFRGCRQCYLKDECTFRKRGIECE